nr:nucleotidyltransferase domain-containing protein [Candidatus Baldrarchaeota archaeon]
MVATGTVELLMRLLRKEADKIEGAILFGSLASGKFGEGSDIDVFVIVKDEKMRRHLSSVLTVDPRVSLDIISIEKLDEMLMEDSPELIFLSKGKPLLESDVLKKIFRFKPTYRSILLAIDESLRWYQKTGYVKTPEMKLFCVFKSLFWMVLARLCMKGDIPTSKRDILVTISNKYKINMKILSEISRNLVFGRKAETFALRLVKILENEKEQLVKDFMDASKRLFEEAIACYENKLYDLAIFGFHSSLEYLLKALTLKKYDRKPLYLLEAAEILFEEGIISREEYDAIKELNALRNSIYHIAKKAEEKDTKWAKEVTENIIRKLKSH